MHIEQVFDVHCQFSQCSLFHPHWDLIQMYSPGWSSSSSSIPSPKYPNDDKVWIYPTATVALTQKYVTYNVTYIRRVLHPEVLTEMQNAIMSPIVSAVFHIYITQQTGCPQDEGREGRETGSTSLNTFTYLLPPIKLPSSAPFLSSIKDVSDGVKAQASVIKRTKAAKWPRSV